MESIPIPSGVFNLPVITLHKNNSNEFKDVSCQSQTTTKNYLRNLVMKLSLSNEITKRYFLYKIVANRIITLKKRHL